MIRCDRRFIRNWLTRNAVEVHTDIQKLRIAAPSDRRPNITFMSNTTFFSLSDRMRFVAALAAAARRGVKVRFLTDAVGCMRLSAVHEDLRSQGIETACFIPFNLLTRRWIFNFRNHRKIVVVDGKRGLYRRAPTSGWST